MSSIGVPEEFCAASVTQLECFLFLWVFFARDIDVSMMELGVFIDEVIGNTGYLTITVTILSQHHHVWYFHKS